MDRAAFEASCTQDGYVDVEQREGEPGFASTPHTHPFAVRGLVLSGEFRLSRLGATETFLEGDSFTMEAGCEHAESFGDEGACYVIARMHDAAAG